MEAELEFPFEELESEDCFEGQLDSNNQQLLAISRPLFKQTHSFDIEPHETYQNTYEYR